MREVTTKIYKFDELSKEAQEYAHENFWMRTEYPWHPEVEDVLRELSDLFSFSVYSWEYDSIMAQHNESYSERHYMTSGDDARQWFKKYKAVINNHNCPLTGYYLDECALDPIRQFLEQPDRTDSVADVLTECVGNVFRAAVSDVEYYYSFESFAESCDANEYEFTENGDIY